MVRPNGSTEAAPKIKEPLIKSLLVILLMGFTPTLVITGSGRVQGRLMNVKAITPNGRRVVSGSEDKTLKVWDLEQGPQERTLEGHQSTGTSSFL